jgi:hypothetical protein
MTTRLLALTAIALVMACDGARAPSGPTAPDASSKLISDGAHGGNPDFFFLPPMVANPVNDPNYEVGKFNSTLAPRLTVEICQLQASPVDASGNPVVTDCVAGPPLKKFAAGTVQLQNMPDGFYQLQWKTRDSNLDVTKYYRIKVLIEGSSIPFGVADVDPVVNMKEFRNARTGEVIPLNDDSTLPIKFRIEHGGGPALCGAAALCTSVVVTNNSPAGFQTVTVDNGTGAVAGAKFPNGWLPADGPQSVVVSISSVDLGATDPVTGAETTPCHPQLALQQFPGCFNFSTTPELQPIDESGRTFAVPVIGAVCFTLYGTNDPRANFVEMYASDFDEPPHALPDASDAGILSPDRRNCSVGTVLASNDRNSLTRFASSGWRRVKSGFGQLFGIKTAYAIDLGLGGFMSAFSNVGPALSATIAPVNNTHFDLVGGGTVNPLVRIIGSNHHDGQHQNSVGIAGLPVTWTVSGSGGTVLGVGEEGAGHTVFTTPTNTFPIDPESPTSGGGYSGVGWTVPSVPGDYTLTANGAALGGPVTFTVTVTPPPAFSVIQGVWQNENNVNPNLTSLDFFVDGSYVGVQAFGACVPTVCDWGVATANTADWNTKQSLGAFWDQGFATRTMLVEYLSATRIKVTVFTDFTPEDGRTDYTLVEYFQRPT